MSTATKLSGAALWAYFAGQDREKRDNCMRDARKAVADGYPNTAGILVQQARGWNKYLVKHIRYAREAV